MFYQANSGFTGSGEGSFEVKISDVQIHRPTTKITVGGANANPGSDAKKEGTDPRMWGIGKHDLHRLLADKAKLDDEI